MVILSINNKEFFLLWTMTLPDLINFQVKEFSFDNLKMLRFPIAAK
jgi:hypothetical protein